MNLAGHLPACSPPKWDALDWRGLHFPNRLGIAGGVDKDGLGIRGWWNFGAGFVEVGTITPKSQPGNAGKRIARDMSHRAVWNRLGFPSQGADRLADRLAKIKTRATPVFANIGKNAVTPLENAHNDYLTLIEHFAHLVDGFVVNISSPNTKGLRELLKPARLKEFIAPLSEKFTSTKKPWLLKISPDIDTQELEAVLQISMEAGAAGWVLTNTSQGLRDGLHFPPEGGVSGMPLAERSKALLRSVKATLGSAKSDRLLISVGGVLTPEDVEERLRLGADLVQVYAALVFSGPNFFRQVARWRQKRRP
jgi:dihydroorotate dehydrogenase